MFKSMSDGDSCLQAKTGAIGSEVGANACLMSRSGWIEVTISVAVVVACREGRGEGRGGS